MIKIYGIQMPKSCGQDCVFCKFNYDIDLWECEILAQKTGMDRK